MRNLTYDYYCNWETNGKRRSPDSPLRCAKKHSAESATEADSALQKKDRVAAPPPDRAACAHRDTDG